MGLSNDDFNQAALSTCDIGTSLKLVSRLYSAGHVLGLKHLQSLGQDVELALLEIKNLQKAPNCAASLAHPNTSTDNGQKTGHVQSRQLAIREEFELAALNINISPPFP